jgi:hypothetical protein
MNNINDSDRNVLGYYPLSNIVDPNFVGRRGSITASSLLNPINATRINGEGGGGVGLGWSNAPGQSPSTLNVYGFDPSGASNAMLHHPQTSRKSSLSGSSIVTSNASDFITKVEGAGSSASTSAPSHRPLVGGGPAAAYEAARAEHYRQLVKNQDHKDTDNMITREYENRDSGPFTYSSSTAPAPAVSLGYFPNNHSMEIMTNFDSSTGDDTRTGSSQGIRNAGLSMHASQHYEMLKLHHMNLLNEIQETTLMMNIYQQQMKQQQQQQQVEAIPWEQEQQQQFQVQDHKDENLPCRESTYHIESDNQSNSSPGEAAEQSEERFHSSCHNNEVVVGGVTSSVETLSHMKKGNGNGEPSREEKLARIKAEIEERTRMLEDLSRFKDEEEEEESSVPSKKPKTSSV